MPISSILAIFAFCFLLLYIAFNLDKCHTFLKMVLIFVVIHVQLILGYFTILDTVTTTLEGIGQIFYNSVRWFIVIFWVYVFLYLIYYVLDYSGKLPKFAQKKYHKGDTGWK